MPKHNALEASIIPDIEVIQLENLKDLIDMLNGDKDLDIQEKINFYHGEIIDKEEIAYKYDFKYVLGQEVDIISSWMVLQGVVKLCLQKLFQQYSQI